MEYLSNMNLRFFAGKERATVLLVCAALTFFHILIINSSATNIPHWDDYDAVLAFLNHYTSIDDIETKLKLIVSQHNEHRIVLDRVFVLFDNFIMGEVNFRHMVFFGNILFLALLVTLFYIFKDTVRKSYYFFLPVPFVLFNLSSYENFIWAMTSIASIGVVFFALFSIYILFADRVVNYNLRFSLSLASAIIATYCIGSGFLALLICPIGMYLTDRKIKYIILWILISALALWLYFKGYTPVPGHPDPFEAFLVYPDKFFTHLLALLGNFFTTGTRFNFAFILVTGFFILSIILYFIPFSKVHKTSPVSFYCILFLFLTCILTSISRSGFGTAQALSTRYHLYSELIVVFIYFVLIKNFDEKRLIVKSMAVLFTAFCIVSFIKSNGYRDNLKDLKNHLLYGIASYNENGLYPSLSYPDQKIAVEVLNRSKALGTYTPPSLTYSSLSGRDLNKTVPPETNNLDHAWDIVPHPDLIFIHNGWAYIEGEEFIHCNTYVLLKSKNRTHVFETFKHLRPDVTNAKKQGNLDYSGFSVMIRKSDLENGDYDIGFYIQKSNSRVYGVEYTGKILRKNNSEISVIDKPFDPEILMNSESKNYIDKYSINDSTLTIRGWGILRGVPSDQVKIGLRIESKNHSIYLPVKIEKRPDVSSVYKGSYDNSGFVVDHYKIDNVPKGEYELVILYTYENVLRQVKSNLVLELNK